MFQNYLVKLQIRFALFRCMFLTSGFIFVVLNGSFLGVDCFGQTFWTDGIGNWNTPSNWSLGVPNAGSGTAFDAVIEDGGTAQLVGSPSGSVRRFRIGRAAGGGNVLVDSATLNIAQDLFLNESGTSASTMTVRNASTVTVPITNIGQSSAANSSLLISGAGTSFNAATQLLVGNSGAGTASLTVDTGATLNSGAAIIGNNMGTNGIATVSNSGSSWSTTSGLTIGGSGSGTLTIQDGSVNVATTLTVGSLGTINLNGGSLRFDGYSNSGTINYTAGTIQLAGDHIVGLDLAIGDLFGLNPVIPSGKDLEIEGGLDTRFNVTVSGGTLRSLDSSDFMRLGFGGNSVLSVSNAGTVTANGQLLVGYPVNTGFSGTVNVSGAGSTVTSNGDFTLSPVGPGTLQVSAGGRIVNNANALLATGSGSNATATVTDANSAWTIAGNASVGTSGTANVTIKDQGLVYVGNDVSINSLSAVNLQGGTLRLNTISSGIARINFSSGTVQLAGDRNIGVDAAINTLFGIPSVIPIGKGLTVEGTATLSQPLTIAGGSFKANALTVAAGGVIDFNRGILDVSGPIMGLSSLAVPTSGTFRVSGVQSFRIAGAAGSTITAATDLTLGDSAAANGFYTDGVLNVGSNTVTLNDANDAAFDTGAFVSLGNGGSPGTLNAANGLTLDFGGNIGGTGVVSTPNVLAKPLINNGHITGNSVGQPITLPGYVKGVGTFDNVSFTGTFSPGLSPTILSVGNINLASTSTLVMELGGTAPGSGYDQLQSTGALAFGGTLQVSLINDFPPSAGQSFNLFDWASTSGNFTSLQLPTLTGLSWNTSQLYTTGVLSVASAGIPGDYNQNGVVDAADYVLWRKFNNTSTTLPNDFTPGTDDSDYVVWRSHFGQQPGSGADVRVNALVPEPPTAVMLLMGMIVTCARRHCADLCNQLFTRRR